MSLQQQNDDTSAGLSAERRALIWKLGALVALLLIVQSVTITPAIRGQLVDAQTGAPLDSTVVTALWELQYASLFESLPDGAVKIAETLTDHEGRFSFKRAIIWHLPLFPFSLLVRSDRYMPALVVTSEQYYSVIAENDVLGAEGPAHDAGLLSIRSTSLERCLIRLNPLPPQPDIDALRHFETRLEMAESRVAAAVSACGNRLLCEDQPLALTQQMLARSLRRQHPPQQ